MMQLARSLPRISSLVLRLGVATFLTSLSLHARAAQPTGKEWVSIIDGLTGFGISKIGLFDLKEFKAQALQIDWGSIDKAPAGVLSGSRQSAYYLFNQKKVYLSDKMPAAAIASLPQLELHEALGATGNNDHNYALSTAMVTLSRTKNAAARAQLLKNYSAKLFPMQMAMVGGTSVSGGGDIQTLFIKDRVLDLVMKAGASAEFLTTYPAIDFEPLTSQNLSQVVIQYTLLREPDAAGQHESFEVFLPMKIWNQGDKGRQMLIRETAQKITQLFPIRAGVASHSFVPTSCQAQNLTVTYPATQDASVLSIQDLRGAYRLGCVEWSFGNNKLQRMSPGVDRTEEPREAGSFGYECTFHYGDASESYQATNAAGSGMNGTDAWSIEQGDDVEGWFGIDGAGKLRYTAITYTPASGGPATRLVPTPPRDATHGSSHIQVNGKTLTFECNGEG